MGAVPLQVPGLAVSVDPCVGVPLIVGGAVLVGGDALAATSAVAADTALLVPMAFVAVTVTRRVAPTSADPRT